MKRFDFAKCAVAAVLALAMVPMAKATTYTSDSNLGDFTSKVSNYATLTNFSSSDCASGSYTPTSASIATGCRVYGGTFSSSGLSSSNNWILATFATATSSVLVFSNIDHFGAAYDGYQYQIWGSNDGSTWTELFDAITVSGSGEPFTLGSFFGTAPTSVNNVLTPGAGPGGTVGYEAFFNFASSYKFYAFGASTEAINAGNADDELSGVGSTTPEPSSLLLLGTGLLGLAGAFRKFGTA